MSEVFQIVRTADPGVMDRARAAITRVLPSEEPPELAGLTSAEGLRRALEEPARKRGYLFEDEALLCVDKPPHESMRALVARLHAGRLVVPWENPDRARQDDP